MAGRVVVSTLNNDTGVLATQNGMTGIAKAWINFNGSTNAIRNSFNVSSITDNGTGQFTINFTTAMADANYSVALTGSKISVGSGNLRIGMIDESVAPTTSAVKILFSATTAAAEDPIYANCAVFGN
jgi:hypothetical protein